MSELNKDIFGKAPAHFVHNLENALQKEEIVMKKKSVTSLLIAAILIILLAAAAYAVVINRNKMITTIDDANGGLIGSSINRDLEQAELKELLAARGLVMRLPSRLPDDFKGGSTPDSVNISCFATGDYADAPEFIEEEDGMRFEYRALTSSMIKEVNENFGRVVVQYIAPNGKSITMVMWIIPSEEAHIRLFYTNFELRDNGDYTFESEHGDKNDHMGYMCQHYSILKDDADQVRETPTEDFPVIMYELLSTDYNMEDLISISESLQE